MSWYYPKQRNDDVEREVTQRNQFDNDDVELSETIVREVVQNSLDALADGSNTGTVKFRWVTPEDGLDKRFFKSLFKGHEQHHKEHAVAAGIEFDELDFSRSDKSIRATGVDVKPEVFDGVGGHRGVAYARCQQHVQQRFVLHIVLLVQPQRFEQVMRFGFIVRVKVGHPFLCCSDDFRRITAAQFDAGAMPDAIDGVFEVVEQHRNGFSMNLDRLL